MMRGLGGRAGVGSGRGWGGGDICFCFKSSSFVLLQKLLLDCKRYLSHALALSEIENTNHVFIVSNVELFAMHFIFHT